MRTVFELEIQTEHGLDSALLGPQIAAILRDLAAQLEYKQYPLRFNIQENCGFSGNYGIQGWAQFFESQQSTAESLELIKFAVTSDMVVNQRVDIGAIRNIATAELKKREV